MLKKETALSSGELDAFIEASDESPENFRKKKLGWLIKLTKLTMTLSHEKQKSMNCRRKSGCRKQQLKV